MTLPWILTEGGPPKAANLVSLLRLLLIAPIAGLVVTGSSFAALLLYMIAIGSDGLDGWLARRANRQSEVGAILDSVVDNILSLAIALFLWLDQPALVAAHPLAFGALFAVPVLYLAVSWLMTGRILMFHFHTARLGAALLFLVWPVVHLTGRADLLSLAAAVVCVSRLEQVLFIQRDGRDQDARWLFSPVFQPSPSYGTTPAEVRRMPDTASRGPWPIQWGAPDARSRGPVLCWPDPDQNAIGIPAGSVAAWRGLAQAGGDLATDHRPDLTGTAPLVTIGPFPQWSQPGRIVTLDPWGHRIGQDFAVEHQAGRSIRPSIAITRGRLRIPEIAALLATGDLVPDACIFDRDGSVMATKIAIDPVWYLPGIATRLGIAEHLLRQRLFETTGGVIPALRDRPDLPLFLPPIGGHSVYLFGNPALLGRPDTTIAARLHDECSGSDVFGSDLCTCRPYLMHGVEEAVRTAQTGGVGVIVYARKEGRALGEVVKYLVYNARQTDPRGDLPESYFAHTTRVAGGPDARAQAFGADVFHWLGIRRIDRWVSMSDDKARSIRAQGIEIVTQVPIPTDLITPGARVEISAKVTAGYYSG